MNAQQWFDEGQLITVNGRRVFVVDSGADLPPLLILHGYPTCGYDYHKVLPVLRQHHRVIIHDHLGFGYSDKPDRYSYSLVDQADQALCLWRQLGISDAVVLAHDYGTSVATELLARNNTSGLPGLAIKQLILCNGSMHVEMAQLRLIQKLLVNWITGPLAARLSSRRTLARNLANIYHDAGRLDESEVDALWTMMTHNQGQSVIHKTSQYIKERYRLWHRWIGALQKTDVPTDIIWAENDPIAVNAMADVLHAEIQNSRLTRLADLGHFPMLEDPARWAQAVLTVLQPDQ